MEDTHQISKAILCYNSRILLLRPKNNIYWHLPGGHLHVNESYINGLKREIKEETNINISKILEIQNKLNFRLYICMSNTEHVKLSSEHTNFKWVDPLFLRNFYLTRETLKDIYYVINNSKSFKQYIPVTYAYNLKKKQLKKAANDMGENPNETI